MERNSQNDYYAGTGNHKTEEPRFVEERIPVPKPPIIEDVVVDKRAAAPGVKQSISVFAVLGFAFSAIMLALVLLARVNLTAVTGDAAKLEARLKELRSEQIQLQVKMENSVDLEEIERIAVDELGMEKGSPPSTRTLEDKTEIFEKAEEPGVMGKLRIFAASFREYLGGAVSYTFVTNSTD